MISEEGYYLPIYDQWKSCLVTGTCETRGIYDILNDEGIVLRRNRSHLKTKCLAIEVTDYNIALQDHQTLQNISNSALSSGPLHTHKNKITF